MSYVVELMTEFGTHRQLLGIEEPSLYEVLLRHGREMTIERLTMTEARHIAKLSRSRGGVNSFKRRECYMNAQKLRLEEYWNGGRRVQYWEGYVAWEGGPLPIGHAWVTINGKVVDVTLRAVDKTKQHSYFGIAVPPKLLMDHMQITERYCPVIEGPLQHRAFPGERRPRMRR
jgi:hypothetical protein